jgi:hypothetical protein
MRIDNEFRRLLSSLSSEVSLSLQEDELQYKDEAVFKAQKTGNLAAVPVAYSNAKLHAFERRVRLTIERFMSALEDCGIELDDAAEKDILREISHVTVGSPHLMFPPAIRGQQATAIRESHAIKMERLRHQLYKEGANRLRKEKIKAHSRADANARSIRIRTAIQADDHPSIQPTMPSQSVAERADFNRDNNSQLAGRVSAPPLPPRYIPNNVKREARKLDTEAKYKSWQKQYRLLRQRHTGMSDVWYSQQIAKLLVAKGAKAETIRRHMKQ